MAASLTSRTGLPVVVRSQGHYLELIEGRQVLDACGGAGVTCIGHGNSEVLSAMSAEASNLTYIPWAFFDNQSTIDLQDWLIQSTGGEMTKVYLQSSGSEAVEAAIKLAREYFVWKGEPQRISFIAREDSYHGITIGSLSVSGHRGRRANFEDILLPNVHRIPACNAYRQKLSDESDEAFVTRKAAELEAAFQAAGTDTIAAFIAEPVVGAALGCVPSPPGYFKAMKAVCEQHGALLILDEVMCGMGRTGTLHAWEQEGVVPDIQCIGKGLAGGYQACSAVLASAQVVGVMNKAKAAFTHGHTFGNHAVVSAAALAVQGIISREGLVANTREQGGYLEAALRQRLGCHPQVGDIRGRGLFWGVEFVRDKASREPFDPALLVAKLVHEKAMAGGKKGGPMMIYHGQGCAGNKRGDHVMIMPAYNVDARMVDVIVQRLGNAVDAAFEELARRGLTW
ncbi:hypothetical protein J7T55_011111 [Diaporthe amygdali]|uniref:uncharacterized protein n=1 Tax=Phomopsis amygdali TaxID=1214568 RepID=UPI0022FED672|nr:uncharacterized protein J7T55_011111 [Diaporthe amygdali]KAJ0104327.1 hypothetical protein J7T55_011111 [Diaporthe amygdali]